MALPTGQQLREFMATYGSTFPYASQLMVPLLTALSEGWIDIMDDMRSADLRQTYRTRAMGLTRREASGEFASTPWVPPTFAAEMRAISEMLDSAPDQPVSIWRFPLVDASSCMIFELCEDRRLAGLLLCKFDPR